MRLEWSIMRMKVHTQRNVVQTCFSPASNPGPTRRQYGAGRRRRICAERWKRMNAGKTFNVSARPNGVGGNPVPAAASAASRAYVMVRMRVVWWCYSACGACGCVCRCVRKSADGKRPTRTEVWDTEELCHAVMQRSPSLREGLFK